MMLVLGLACLVLALGFLAAAKGRYTVQPAEQRGPFSRTILYGGIGIFFAGLALVLIPQASR